MIVEVIGGYLANSIAIMSDAAHLFSDLLGFIISIISIHIAKKQANNHMSYGYHRAEVIGALASVTIIWGLTIWLIYEASYRIFNPKPVSGGIMFVVAVLGLLFNITMGLILAYEGIDHGMHHHHDHDHDDHHHHDHDHHNHEDDHHEEKELKVISHDNCTGHKNEIELKDNQEGLLKSEEITSNTRKTNKHDSKKSIHSHHKHNHSNSHSHSNKNENINIRAAMIHIIGDAIQNIGVIISGATIYFYPTYVIIDSLCTFFFAIVVFMTTIRILKDCVLVIMEGSPIENIEEMENQLLEIEGVIEVHDLHVWSLSMGKLSMTCHLISTKPQESLTKACEMIKIKYNIDHTTIQVEEEREDEDKCKQTLH